MVRPLHWNLGRGCGGVTASLFVGNSGFTASGHSIEQNIRGRGEARTTVSVTRHYTAAAGFSVAREEITNSYITDARFAMPCSPPRDRRVPTTG
jgi:hypothetical protein